MHYLLLMLALAPSIAHATEPAASPRPEPAPTSPESKAAPGSSASVDANPRPEPRDAASLRSEPPGVASRSPIPGLSSESFGIRPGRFYPEGTFLVRRRGEVRVLKTGDAVFIPERPSPRDLRRRGERPMVLLPSQTLASMVVSMGEADRLRRVELSGQMFVYRDRQQLLPTVFTVLTDEDAEAANAPSTTASSAPSASNPPPSAATNADDPEVDDLIRSLESRRSTSAPATGASRAARSEEAEAEASRPLVNEGTLISDRRGRLVRVNDRLAVAFDGDASTPADPPMIVQRSRALERLENAAGARPEGVQIIVTGRVFSYKGENYLLPLLAQIEVAGQLTPMQ